MGAKRSPNALYLLGAGRSGTTILAAILSGHEQIEWHGELIHLVDWENIENLCSCGAPLRNCGYWVDHDIDSIVGPAMEKARVFEAHKKVLQALLNRNTFPDTYRRQQLSLVHALVSDDSWLLDSSKYVGRAIGLAGIAELNTKFIYVVRDARGVIFSFGKRVQTRRTLLSACWYYFATNAVAQLAAWTALRGKCMKLRYEDLVDDPEGSLNRLESFLELDLGQVGRKVVAGESFTASHIAGGNRWAKRGPAILKVDTQWRQTLGWPSRLLVYAICLPFQLINRYGI